MRSITVSTIVNAPKETVWELWTGPEHIVKWNFASDDWESTAARNDVRAGGTFSIAMGAKDGSSRFDFEGTYTDVKEHELLEYVMEDGRTVVVCFIPRDGGIEVAETFDLEHEHSDDEQREGWQAILESFKRYVEKNA